MAANCENKKNTGWFDNCDANFKLTAGLFFMNTLDSTGVKNKIAAGTEIDEAYILARLNDVDPTKRWYPLQGIEAPASVREEPVVFTNPSGATENVRDGARNQEFELRLRGPEFLGQIEACACEKRSVFYIDNEGKLRGTVLDGNAPVEEQDFYPIRIQPNTFKPQLIVATPDNPEHLLVKFQIDLKEKDSLLRTYPTSLVTAELLDAEGLYDVYGSYSSITTTGFILALSTRYTDGDDQRPQGLVAGDFLVENLTTPATITPSSVTEVTPGRYTFVFTAQTSDDVIRVTPTKNGFDFSAVADKTVTIP